MAQEFFIIVKRSEVSGMWRNGNVLLSCDREGIYRNRNVKIQDKRRASNTGSKKCGCPFLLKGKELSNTAGWVLMIVCGIHNHYSTKNLDEQWKNVWPYKAEQNHNVRPCKAEQFEPVQPCRAEHIRTVRTCKAEHKRLARPCRVEQNNNVQPCAIEFGRAGPNSYVLLGSARPNRIKLFGRARPNRVFDTFV